MAHELGEAGPAVVVDFSQQILGHERVTISEKVRQGLDLGRRHRRPVPDSLEHRVLCHEGPHAGFDSLAVGPARQSLVARAELDVFLDGGEVGDIEVDHPVGALLAEAHQGRQPGRQLPQLVVRG